MNILVEATYLAHEGGTKFYEAISFWNSEDNRGVLIKRWGKMTQRNGGGECKVEPFGDVRQLQDGYAKILNDKNKRGYSRARPDFDYLNGSAVYAKRSEFISATANHFAGSGVEFSVYSLLGIKDLLVREDEEADDIVIEEPKPEPIRDANWGSW